MMNVSLWSHLVALIAFLGLAVWVAVLRRQRLTLAALMGYGAKVHVDWPMRSLRQVCAALGIPVDAEGNDRLGDPIRIDWAAVSEFFRAHHVSRVSGEWKNGIINVTIEVTQTVASSQAQLLAGAFQNRIVVQISQKGSA